MPDRPCNLDPRPEPISCIEHPETLGRFLRRFYLIAKGTLFHPTTDTYIDDLPDGRMVAREVGRGLR